MTVYVLDSTTECFGVSEREFMMIVDFAIKELSIPNTLDIQFEFEAVEDYTGFCHNYNCENGVVVVIAPGLQWGTMVKTIFHEMTHVQQIVTKQLSGTVWRGVPVDVTSFDDHEKLPWEVEAYAMENHLYDKYISISED